MNCGEGMELHCWNSLCPWIIGVCRCSDDESFKLGEVGVVTMVGDGVGIGVGAHQSSGVDIGAGSHHCSDVTGCVLAVDEAVGDFVTRKSQMSVCRSCRPRICFVFVNCFTIVCAFAFLFSGLSGGGCCCRWMRLLCLVPVAVVVDGVAVVDSCFQLLHKPVPFLFVTC